MSCQYCNSPVLLNDWAGNTWYKCGTTNGVRSESCVDREPIAADLQNALDRIKRLEDCIETAWGIIANVSGGDWTRQKPHWQEAVVRWRDNDFHPIMKELSERKAKEAKP